jgi:serine-type D-Ala-D-Ala carboxypeptidase (penicillin-binding protein 5/6)
MPVLTAPSTAAAPSAPAKSATAKPAVIPATRATSADLTKVVGSSAKAYLVYDMTTEQVVGQRNAGISQPIASLTKLMTAILTAERLRFDGQYVLTGKEVATYGTDRLRADKMLEMMMVCSNNGMCRVVSRIARGNTGTFTPADEEWFVSEMNQRAAQMGLKHTRFATSSGLPGGQQYSNVWDVMTLLRVALANPRVRAQMSAHNASLGGKTYKGTLYDLYMRHPGLEGGKTGYTRAAGRCLALVYSHGGHDYALVTLGSSGVRASFRDAELILKHYGLYDGPVGEWK